MPLTKEEIREIALQVAAEVIEKHLTYHDPKTVEQGLQQSFGEEMTASMWYQFRARHARGHGDEKTARLYEQIAAEENHHLEEFNRRLNEAY